MEKKHSRAKKPKKDYTENITNVIFDKDLIDSVNRIDDEYGHYFAFDKADLLANGGFNPNKIPECVRLQNEMRRAFDDEFKKGNIKTLNGEELDMQDYFALFMLFIFIENSRTIENWDELLIYLNTLRTDVQGQYPDVYCEEEHCPYEPREDKTKLMCACGHWVKDLFAFINLSGNRFVIVGCVCIYKVTIKEGVNNLKKQINVAKKKTIAYRKSHEEAKKKHEQMLIIKKKQDEIIHKFKWGSVDMVCNAMRKENIPVPCFYPLKCLKSKY
jgi:hypothetical protein